MYVTCNKWELYMFGQPVPVYVRQLTQRNPPSVRSLVVELGGIYLQQIPSATVRSYGMISVEYRHSNFNSHIQILDGQ